MDYECKKMDYEKILNYEAFEKVISKGEFRGHSLSEIKNKFLKTVKNGFDSYT